ALVAMADVHAHQLAVEVDEALAFGRPEVDALRAGHGDRIDFRLSGPLEERVLLRQRDHLFAGHCFRCDFGCHLTAFFHNDVGGRSLFLTTKTRKKRRTRKKHLCTLLRDLLRFFVLSWWHLFLGRLHLLLRGCSYFFSIASRLAWNSLPGFHSGNLSACATR